MLNGIFTRRFAIAATTIALAVVVTLRTRDSSATSAVRAPRVPPATPDTLRDEAAKRLAQIDGRITIPGLDSAVEVRRDRWGVPHIYARTEHDLFFAQG